MVKIPSTVSAEGNDILVVREIDKLGLDLIGRVSPVGENVIARQGSIGGPDSSDKFRDIELNRLDSNLAAGLDLLKVVKHIRFSPELGASVKSDKLTGVAFEGVSTVSSLPTAFRGVAFLVAVSII
jgi:hypothetical protein